MGGRALRGNTGPHAGQHRAVECCGRCPALLAELYLLSGGSGRSGAASSPTARRSRRCVRESQVDHAPGGAVPPLFEAFYMNVPNRRSHNLTAGRVYPGPGRV